MSMSTAPVEPLELGILLNLAFGAVKQRLHAHLAAAGFDDLGPTFGYIFRLLDGASPSLAVVAGRLGITAQGALKIVGEMVAKGYIERVDDEQDRRIRRLRLTGRGKRALQEARKFYATYERALRGRLGGSRVTVARGVLEAIVAEGEAVGLERRARPF
jgi:DNA-binding MarR family transcriptional regulator